MRGNYWLRRNLQHAGTSSVPPGHCRSGARPQLPARPQSSSARQSVEYHERWSPSPPAQDTCQIRVAPHPANRASAAPLPTRDSKPAPIARRTARACHPRAAEASPPCHPAAAAPGPHSRSVRVAWCRCANPRQAPRPAPVEHPQSFARNQATPVRPTRQRPEASLTADPTNPASTLQKRFFFTKNLRSSAKSAATVFRRKARLKPRAQSLEPKPRA